MFVKIFFKIRLTFLNIIFPKIISKSLHNPWIFLKIFEII